MLSTAGLEWSSRETRQLLLVTLNLKRQPQETLLIFELYNFPAAKKLARSSRA